MVITACSSKNNEPVETAAENTTLPVEAYTGDVKYSYSVNENGETVTVVMPDAPDNKFTETVSETTAVPETNVAEEEPEETTSKAEPANTDGDAWLYSDFKGKEDKQNLSRLYPLKAVVIPDTIDFTTIQAETGQIEVYDTDGKFLRYDHEYTDVDLTEQTVLSMADYGFRYRKGNADVQEYSDDNYYYWGCDFDYASLESVIKDKVVSNWDEENPDSFDKPLKAFMTTGDTDAKLYGGINQDMDKDDIEAILGKGYEVSFTDKYETDRITAYYQNKKGAFVVGYINKRKIDFIAIVIRDENDKCEEIPQPKPAETTTAETVITEPDPMKGIKETVEYESKGLKVVYQHNFNNDYECYIFYVDDDVISDMDKSLYNQLIVEYSEAGYDCVKADK